MGYSICCISLLIWLVFWLVFTLLLACDLLLVCLFSYELTLIVVGCGGGFYALLVGLFAYDLCAHCVIWYLEWLVLLVSCDILMVD